MKTKNYLIIIVLLLGFYGCHEKTTPPKKDVITFNKELELKINTMYKLDQYVSGMPQDKYEGDWQGWFKFRDSISKKHKIQLEKILDTYGYPGFDLVGEEASHNYWNMAQHCDFDTAFQENVLDKLTTAVKNNDANPSNIGFLTDRINVNLGKPQVYGTQLDYDMSKCTAFPKGGLFDSINVDNRRAALKMESYKLYLNELLKFHFEMNKVHYDKIGITEPAYY